MIPENEKLMNDLIDHLKLGKPILNKARKPISNNTAKKYKIWITKLDLWLNKDFTQLTQEDVDAFRIKFRDDKIRKENGQPYQQSVKRDVETKFLRIILNFVEKHDIALFSSSYNEEKEIPALKKEEVETVISQVKLRDKLIWQIPFDGGVRIDEFSNIRFIDIKDDCLESNGYYKIRIIKSKTKTRTVGLTLPLSTELIKEWLKVNKDKIGTNKPLIDLSKTHIRLTIQRQGLKILKKRVYPHLLRHSSATYYCHHLSQYQICKRYGWTMSSDMPQKYIDREGVDDEEINKKVVGEENQSLMKTINSLKEKLSIQQEQIGELQEQNNDIGVLKQQQKTIDTLKKQMEELLPLIKKVENIK